MFKTNTFTRTTAIALASTMLVSSLGTSVTASAHDRHAPGQHGANHHNWNKHTHRQFHRNYGRGHQGVQNYQYELERQRHHAHQQQLEQQRQHAARKDRKRAKRTAIAIGAIGLVAGAIIASQASKNRNQRGYTNYQAPATQPNHQYDAPQRQSLDDFSNNTGPEVITFNESASLEPWTPGWKEWCADNYRSFNVNTGTYRGFDGLDHFCVPK